jgi:hypothetical protein
MTPQAGGNLDGMLFMLPWSGGKDNYAAFQDYARPGYP